MEFKSVNYQYDHDYYRYNSTYSFEIKKKHYKLNFNFIMSTSL